MNHHTFTTEPKSHHTYTSISHHTFNNKLPHHLQWNTTYPPMSTHTHPIQWATTPHPVSYNTPSNEPPHLIQWAIIPLKYYSDKSFLTIHEYGNSISSCVRLSYGKRRHNFLIVVHFMKSYYTVLLQGSRTVYIPGPRCQWLRPCTRCLLRNSH